MIVKNHHQYRTFWNGQDISPIVVDSGDYWATVLVCCPNQSGKWEAMEHSSGSPLVIRLDPVVFVEPDGTQHPPRVRPIGHDSGHGWPKWIF